MLVKRCLHGELLRLDAAILLGIVLVDELDSEYWFVGVEWCSFLDAAAPLAVVEPVDV